MTVRAAPPNAGASVEFGDFRLDRRGGRLLHGRESIPLRPKTWAVLLHLVDHAGGLVSRDDLLDAVWRDVAVTPDTLTKSIGELRDALGDDARQPRYIETVHRRGFRFIATLASGPSSEDAPHADAAGAVVGRDHELRRLRALLVDADAGRRQLAFLTAGAGVGKTALVNSLLAAVAAEPSPPRVGRGGCFEPHATCEPYMPVLDALERLARGSGGEAVVSLMRRLAPTWLAQLPGLAAGDEPVAPPASRPERMLREFAVLTEALSASAPLILVLEDLHWSDPSTVDLLSFLGARREPARLLIVATYRPAEVAVSEHPLAQAARALQRQAQAVAIPLHELSGPDVRRYFELRFPGAPFADSLAALVHEYTDGNALFMVAVVEHLVSRGWILDTDPGWALTIEPRRDLLEVPEEARQLIRMQFDSTAPSDRAVLEIAGVVGREFAVPVVAAVLGAEPESVEVRCEALARSSRFLRPAGSDEWLRGGSTRRYAFVHELYREACYADIDDGRRRRLHQKVGEALEAILGERAAEAAAELAHHFGRAGDHARAVRYLEAAAATARRRFASREAAGHLRSALAAVALLPGDERRAARELELRIALAPSLADLHGFGADELLENAQRAYALCRAVGSDEQRFHLVYALSHLHAMRADPQAADAMAAELEALARRLGTAGHRLLAESALLRIGVNGCRFVQACRLGERIAAQLAAGVVPAATAFGADPIVAAHGHYALALWMIGDGVRARVLSREALAGAERLGQPFTLANALWFAALLARLLGDDASAAAHADGALALAREQGFAQWEGAALALRGWARVRRGELREGIAEIEAARLAIDGVRGGVYGGVVLTALADALLRHGAIEAGLAAVAEGIARGESSRDRWLLPELWRLEASLRQARGMQVDRRARRADAAGKDGWEDAEACLRRAIELARATEARAFELRAAVDLARLWQERGRAREARALLRAACASFADDPANQDLAAARQLLAAPTSPARRRAG